MAKAVPSMSPLQFQRVLRLNEARRLMLFQRMDAGDACQRVGYLSASQITREYGRLFGNAPTRDVARLREEGFAPSEADRSLIDSRRLAEEMPRSPRATSGTCEPPTTS